MKKVGIIICGRYQSCGDGKCFRALLAAMKKYLQLGGPAYLLNIYNWLGDPALECK